MAEVNFEVRKGLTVPRGTAAVPSIVFDPADLNTGLYSPGADQLALAPNGAGRLFVDASGRVGIGASSPSASIHLGGSAAQTIRINSATSAGFVGSSGYITQIAANRNPVDGTIVNTGTATCFINLEADVSNGNIQFCTTGTNNEGALERMRITAAGLVGIGTSSPSAEVHIVGSGATQLWLQRSGGYNPVKISTGLADGNGFKITMNTTDAFAIDSTGKVGIGTTTPAGLLDLASADGATALAIAGWRAASWTGSVLQWGGITSGQWSTAAFFTAGSERARIDSSGRLLVGTSSDSGGALLQVNGDRIRIATAKTPASATATGTTGEVCWDTSYIYVCTATNTWKRAALSTWCRLLVLLNDLRGSVAISWAHCWNTIRCLIKLDGSRAGSRTSRTLGASVLGSAAT